MRWGKSYNLPKGLNPLCPSLRLILGLELALTQAVAPACLQDAFCPSLGILWEVRTAQKIGVDTEGQDLAEEGDGSLPHGLCIPNIGTDDLSKRLLHTLERKEAGSEIEHNHPTAFVPHFTRQPKFRRRAVSSPRST